MRTRRVGFAVFFLLLAAVLLGSGVASARPVETRVVSSTAVTTPFVTPADHTGRHCRTRRDPVAPDPTDV